MRKKKIGKTVGIVLAVLLAAIAIGGILFSMEVGKQVGEGILYQNEGNDTKGNSVKQLEKSKYDLEGFRKAYGGLSQEIRVTAEDGNEVPAELFAIDGSKNTVILVHGHGGDHVVNYPIAQIYLENNWNVITFDQRGAGDNPDKRVSFGYFEKMDVKALVDYAADNMQSDKVVVHGQSMGAATAGLYAATAHAAENVDAIIMDSCFYSMEEAFLAVWREMEGTGGIPEEYIIACGDWYLRHNYGFGFADADICEKMKENRVKTLMLQMNQDDLITKEKAEEMFENIVARDKNICYFNSKHIEGLIDEPEKYKEDVFSFIGE